MPDFSTEKKSQHSHVNIHMLTRDFSFKHRWTDYCQSTEAKDLPLSTSFFAGFRKFQRFHCLPTCSKSCDAPQLGGFVFTYVPVSVWQPADVHKNKTTQSWRVTGFAARSRRQTMEPLEFSKTGKKRLKRQIFCFCGLTVVSSTVFEREISCQHVDVNMRMLRFFSGEKSGIIPRWGQSVSDRDFHTCLFFMYDSLVL